MLAPLRRQICETGGVSVSERRRPFRKVRVRFEDASGLPIRPFVLDHDARGGAAQLSDILDKVK